MQTRNDRCAPCYGRRAVLGPVLGLALAPLLVGVARAEDEPEKTDAARLPPQPGDRLVFLTGPSKGQVVRLDNLAMGGPQVQVFPAGPDGTVRNGTPLNLVILARFDPAELSDETQRAGRRRRRCLFRRLHPSGMPGEYVVEGARWVCLLLPRLGL